MRGPKPKPHHTGGQGGFPGRLESRRSPRARTNCDLGWLNELARAKKETRGPRGAGFESFPAKVSYRLSAPCCFRDKAKSGRPSMPSVNLASRVDLGAAAGGGLGRGALSEPLLLAGRAA